MVDTNLEAAVDTLRFIREARGPNSHKAATHLRRWLLAQVAGQDGSDADAVRRAVLYRVYPEDEEKEATL